MNLTKYDRQAFVKAVLDDVPQIDYNEQARAKATAAVIDLLPKEVKAIYHTHPQFLNNGSILMPGSFHNLYIPRDPDGDMYDMLERLCPALWAELEELSNLHEKQRNARAELEVQLTAIIKTCCTLNQARERLPEFEKYLPAERGSTGTTNLPVANLIAELTKAGWPKGKAPACTE